MTVEQLIVSVSLVAAMVLFIWGRWRYDVVAFTLLMFLTLTGSVPSSEAFAGFGHPAVITVAAVLAISRALQNSGAIDVLAARLMGATATPLLHIGAFAAMGMMLSGFMNNVGALALLLPVALHTAANSPQSPAQLLMPLSFGSILGGLMTLIGTPPNIIIATYRETAIGAPFTMFDFAPVGVAVAVTGTLFVSLVGWRLIPRERRAKKSPQALFEIKDYVTEVQVLEGSEMVGQPVRAIESLSESNVLVVGLVRGESRQLGLPYFEHLQADDIVIVETESAVLAKIVDDAGLKLVGRQELSEEHLESDEVGLVEAVVSPGSRIEWRTARQLRLRSRFGVNLIAISRQGKSVKERIDEVGFRAGDVLLLQGDAESLPETVAELGCMPLAPRGLKLQPRPGMLLTLAIFAIALIATASGLLAVHVAFGAAVVALVLSNAVKIREVYESIDWSVLVLLASMIPVGSALESTGATEVAAAAILTTAGSLSPMLITALLLVVTMTLSDVMNNAATAVVMAPIAASLATQLGVNPDAFLMAVALGASCAFLTPIGHQNNILVMGPAGYKFGDYWRMGLPLELLVIAVGVPMIGWVWGF